MIFENRLKKRQKQEKRKAKVEAKARKRQKRLDKRHRREAILRGETWATTYPSVASIFESGRVDFVPPWVPLRTSYGLDLELTTALNWRQNPYSYLGIPGRPREKYDWKIEGF